MDLVTFEYWSAKEFFKAYRNPFELECIDY